LTARLPQGRAARARFVAACGLALGAAAGCDRGEPRPLPVYASPKRRPPPAEASCEGVAKSWPEARRAEGALKLRVGPASKIEVADASALGGPFETPLGLEAPAGLYPVDVVVGRGSAGPNLPLCVRVRLGEAPIASWRELGDVTIDSDVLVLADAVSFHRSLPSRTRAVFAAVEADAAELERVRHELSSSGMPLTPLLPTLARAMRPLAPGDEALARRAIAGKGRFLIEPASPGWDVLGAMGDADYVELSFDPETPQGAVAIVSGQGSGAYTVAAGHGAGGELAALEVRLAP
jgi:hypothetical protein